MSLRNTFMVLMIFLLHLCFLWWKAFKIGCIVGSNEFYVCFFRVVLPPLCPLLYEKIEAEI